MTPQEAREQALSKISRYNLKQLKAHLNSELKFFVQNEKDLLTLTSANVLQLITLFLQESLDLPEAQECLVENFD